MATAEATVEELVSRQSNDLKARALITDTGFAVVAHHFNQGGPWPKM